MLLFQEDLCHNLHNTDPLAVIFKEAPTFHATFLSINKCFHNIHIQAYCDPRYAALLPFPEGGRWVAVLSEPLEVNFSLVFTPIAVRPADAQLEVTIWRSFLHMYRDVCYVSGNNILMDYCKAENQ